jgi:hypothetical protein
MIVLRCVEGSASDETPPRAAEAQRRPVEAIGRVVF